MKKAAAQHYASMVSAYDKAAIVYRLAWSLNQSMAMTFGYWDESTQQLAQAHKNLYRVLAEKAAVHQQDRVLDAGCATGGGAIYLAENFGCQVFGINLSQRQLELATRFAKRQHVEKSVTFIKADYTQTSFEDNSYDIVWAVESLFHAPDKEAFIREASRLLKPNGRLIIADYFLQNEDIDPAQDDFLADWFEGFSIPNLATQTKMTEWLTAHNFQQPTWDDVSNNVLPSSKRLYRLGKTGLLLTKPIAWLPLPKWLPLDVKHLKGTIGQYKALKAKKWSYQIVVAAKS